MLEIEASVQEARAHLRDPKWEPERAARVLASVQRRHARSAISSVALGSAALAVAVAIAIVWFAQGGSHTSAPAPVLVDNQIELRDGTRAVGLGQASSVKLVGESDALVSFALESGKGWFEVSPSETRRVEVQVKDVRVVVLGTEFVVEVKGEFVHVWVQRGKVKVFSGAETILLTTGEEGRFPARDPSGPADEQVFDAGTAMPLPQPIDQSMSRPERSPRENHVDPETSLTVPRVPPGREGEVILLWKQADSARLRGDSAAAITALTALLSEHPDDPRAALAAFSLGRVLVDSDGSSQTAARAFAKARKLAPEGPLVEDALLREIEAWYQAGDQRRVVSRSNKYLRTFPTGRYRKQVEEMRSSP